MMNMRQALSVLALGTLLAGACGDQAARSEPRRPLLGDMTLEQAFGDPAVRALAQAACEGDVATLQVLVRRVDPNTRGFEDTTPLLWAMNCRNIDGFEQLLLLGADANQLIRGTRGSFSPVFVAAGYDDPSFLMALLRHGGDPDTAYEGGSPSALEEAFALGIPDDNWANYYALLEAGADFNQPAGSHTITEYAANFNQFDKVAELLDRGYNHNLPRLGLAVQTINEPVMDPEQIRWARRVREMLEERGVRFPVTPQDAGFDPPT